MSRHRSAEYDYVCLSCGVAIDISTLGHHPGPHAGRSRCKRPQPILRSEYEAIQEEFAQQARAALADRIDVRKDEEET